MPLGLPLSPLGNTGVVCTNYERRRGQRLKPFTTCERVDHLIDDLSVSLPVSVALRFSDSLSLSLSPVSSHFDINLPSALAIVTSSLLVLFVGTLRTYQIDQLNTGSRTFPPEHTPGLTPGEKCK